MGVGAGGGVGGCVGVAVMGQDQDGISFCIYTLYFSNSIIHDGYSASSAYKPIYEVSLRKIRITHRSPMNGRHVSVVSKLL